MELVYLWVEEYKNIYRQGFNFSPRFECSFDGENLTIDDKSKDYVNIFLKNINVTAIVGENGSGKSSILKSLNSYRTTDKLKITILKIENKLILFHNINDFISTNIIESNQTYVLTKLNNKDFASIDTSYKNILFSTIAESLPLFISNSIIANNHKVFDTLNSIEMLQNANIQLPFKKPKKIYLKVKYADDLDKDIQKQIKIKGIQNDFIEQELFYEDSDEYRIRLLKFYYLAQYIHLQRDLGSSYYCIVEKCNTNIPTNIDDLIAIFSECIGQEQVINDIDFIIQEINAKFEYYKDYCWRIDIDSLDKVFVAKIKSTLLTTSNVSLSIYDTFIFSFENQLSDGQYQFLLKFGKIYNYCQQDTLLLIDEGDILLHPNWQKKFINYLLKFLEDNFNQYKYHLIITSHSPFILSDLPKENVIFLKNGKQDNPDIEQTFGANIHTLLSNGFFMSDGLMGEFAKGKITEIIEILKKPQLSEDEIKDCKHIISIIGEPILQKTLEHQLNEKLNPNETELQKLQREQQEIQAKIDKLEGNQ